jgi:hypothetical protein
MEAGKSALRNALFGHEGFETSHSDSRILSASRIEVAELDARCGSAVSSETASKEERNGEKRVGLPHRIVDILEGESLVNNATGLLPLEFGVAMVVSGQTPTVGDGFSRLTYLTFAGLALGLIVGAIVERP